MSKFAKYLIAFSAIFSAEMLWATSISKADYDQLEDKSAYVASVGTNAEAANYYTDLQEAFTALQGATQTENYRLTLVKDTTITKSIIFVGNPGSSFTDPYGAYAKLSLSAPHTRAECFLIDLNGKAITFDSEDTTVSSYAIDFKAQTSGAYSTTRVMNGSILAKGGSLGSVNVDGRIVRFINVTMQNGSANTPTCKFGSNNLNGLLKGCAIENALAGGAVYCSGIENFIHSSTIKCATGKAICVAQAGRTANGALRGAFACSASTVTGVDAVYVDKSLNKVPAYITGGQINGKVTDKGAHLTACGGTFTKDPEVLFLDGYAKRENADGTFTIIEDVTVKVDGIDSTISDAFNFEGIENRTIQLQHDIFLLAMEEEKHAIWVKNGQNVTLDLNNHTINVFDVSCGFKDINCVKIEKGGTFNLVDTSDNKTGLMTFAAWVMDARSEPGWASNVMTVSGTLNVSAGTVENRAIYVSGVSIASYCADIYPSYKDGELGGLLNISGGELRDTGIPVRMFNGPGREELNMTGGFLNGGLTAIWLHLTKDAHVNITGGKVYGLGTLAAIYNEGDKANSVSDVIIDGDAEIKGHVYCEGTHKHYFTLNGGTYIGNYKIKGYEGTIDVIGGVYDRAYIDNILLLKYYPGEDMEKYFGVIVETEGSELMIDENDHYVFGSPKAKLTAMYLLQGNTVYHYTAAGSMIPTSSPYYDNEGAYTFGPCLVNKYKSFALAIKDIGKTQAVRYNNFSLIGQHVSLIGDDESAIPMTGVYLNPQSVDVLREINIYLNGHTVVSTATDPLFVFDDKWVGYPTVFRIKGEGSIKSGGLLFKSDDSLADSNIEIYGGNYSTTGDDGLFAGNVKVIADVGDGSYFDVNPASFSHDVSGFIHNEDGNIAFKTINPMTERYYLGRVVEVEDAPQK